MEKNAQTQPEEIIYIRNELLRITKNLDNKSVAYPISRGLFVILDKDIAEDFRDNKTVWYTQATHSGVYAVKVFNNKRVYLQQYISGHKQVTFKNKFTLDCRRTNLIGKSRTDIRRNSTGKKDTTSRYKGVHLKNGKWYTEIKYDAEIKKRQSLGYWKTEIEAARMYDCAVQYFWEEALINFPNEDVDESLRVILKKYIQKRIDREKRKKEKEALKNNISK
jgi:hypothetical protein